MFRFNLSRHVFGFGSEVNRLRTRRPEHGRARLVLENLESRLMMAAKLAPNASLAPQPQLGPVGVIANPAQMQVVNVSPAAMAAASLPRLDFDHPNAVPSDPQQVANEVRQAILSKYNATAANLGAAGAWVYTTMYGVKNGTAVTAKVPQYLQCASGIVFYSGYLWGSPQVAEAHGVTYDKWMSVGGPASALSGPTQDTTVLSGGEFTKFKHGAVTWSPETDAHVLTALSDLWRDQPFYIYQTGQTLPATIDVLGYPTMDETTTPDGSTDYCEFQKGIAIGKGTSAVELHGPIYDLWASQGKFASPLGMPITSVLPTRDGTGQYSLFEHGAICYTDDFGIHIISPGPVLDLWEGNIDNLGVATADQATNADGSIQYQNFQNGLIATYPGGTFEIHGPIWRKWTDMGGFDSPLGAPSTNVIATVDGRGEYVRFENGSIYNSAVTGTRALLLDVRDKYESLDLTTRQALGLPITDSVATADSIGRWAHFEHGSIIWSPSTGAHNLQDVIDHKWTSYGWSVLSLLGYPTTDTVVSAGDHRYNDFQHGTISWSPARQALQLNGAIWDKWRNAGRATVLGDQTTDETPASARALFSLFDHGAIYVNPNPRTSVVCEVKGPIYDKWASMGLENSPLGYPKSDAMAMPGSPTDRVQYFDGGEIDWIEAGNQIQVKLAFGKNSQFNFHNISFYVSPVLVMDAFGEQSYYSIWNPFGDDVRVPTPGTLAFWAFAAAAVDVKGGCFGMALTSLDFYHHPDWINADNGLAPGAPPVTNNLMGTNGNLWHTIEMNHLHQFSAESINYYLNWQVDDHSSASIHAQLDTLLGNYDPPIISLNESLGKGHAVVATGVEPGAGPNDYYIDVYDSNRENYIGPDAQIHVTADNQWFYKMASGDVWSGGFGSLTVVPYDVVSGNQTMPTSLDNLPGIIFNSGAAGFTGGPALQLGNRGAALPRLVPVSPSATSINFSSPATAPGIGLDEATVASILQGSPADLVSLNPQPLPPKAGFDLRAVDSVMQDLSSPADLVSLNPQPLPPKVSFDLLAVDSVMSAFGDDAMSLNLSSLATHMDLVA
jgi:uncharacterized protein with LGFP repeats